MELANILTDTLLYNGDHYALVEYLLYLFNLIAMNFCFVHLSSYAFSVYLTPLHLKSHLTAGFNKDGQRKKTDLSYTQDISRSRGIRILYAFYLLYFVSLRNEIFTLVPV